MSLPTSLKQFFTSALSISLPILDEAWELLGDLMWASTTSLEPGATTATLSSEAMQALRRFGIPNEIGEHTKFESLGYPVRC